jgi:hypothetical protein
VAEVLRGAYVPIRKLITAGSAEAAWAWKEMRAGGYRALGGTGVITGVPAAYVYRQELITFVVDNASNLKIFVDHTFSNPELIRIIDLVVQAVARAGAL